VELPAAIRPFDLIAKTAARKLEQDLALGNISSKQAFEPTDT